MDLNSLLLSSPGLYGGGVANGKIDPAILDMLSVTSSSPYGSSSSDNAIAAAAALNPDLLLSDLSGLNSDLLKAKKLLEAKAAAQTSAAAAKQKARLMQQQQKRKKEAERLLVQQQATRNNENKIKQMNSSNNNRIAAAAAADVSNPNNRSSYGKSMNSNASSANLSNNKNNVDLLLNQSDKNYLYNLDDVDNKNDSTNNKSSAEESKEVQPIDRLMTSSERRQKDQKDILDAEQRIRKLEQQKKMINKDTDDRIARIKKLEQQSANAYVNDSAAAAASTIQMQQQRRRRQHQRDDRTTNKNLNYNRRHNDNAIIGKDIINGSSVFASDSNVNFQNSLIMNEPEKYVAEKLDIYNDNNKWAAESTLSNLSPTYQAQRSEIVKSLVNQFINAIKANREQSMYAKFNLSSKSDYERDLYMKPYNEAFLHFISNVLLPQLHKIYCSSTEFISSYETERLASEYAAPIGLAAAAAANAGYSNDNDVAYTSAANYDPASAMNQYNLLKSNNMQITEASSPFYGAAAAANTSDAFLNVFGSNKTSQLLSPINQTMLNNNASAAAASVGTMLVNTNDIMKNIQQLQHPKQQQQQQGLQSTKQQKVSMNNIEDMVSKLSLSERKDLLKKLLLHSSSTAESSPQLQVSTSSSGANGGAEEDHLYLVPTKKKAKDMAFILSQMQNDATIESFLRMHHKKQSYFIYSIKKALRNETLMKKMRKYVLLNTNNDDSAEGFYSKNYKQWINEKVILMFNDIYDDDDNDKKSSYKYIANRMIKSLWKALNRNIERQRFNRDKKKYSTSKNPQPPPRSKHDRSVINYASDSDDDYNVNNIISNRPVTILPTSDSSSSSGGGYSSDEYDSDDDDFMQNVYTTTRVSTDSYDNRNAKNNTADGASESLRKHLIGIPAYNAHQSNNSKTSAAAAAAATKV